MFQLATIGNISLRLLHELMNFWSFFSGSGRNMSTGRKKRENEEIAVVLYNHFVFMFSCVIRCKN